MSQLRHWSSSRDKTIASTIASTTTAATAAATVDDNKVLARSDLPRRSHSREKTSTSASLVADDSSSSTSIHPKTSSSSPSPASTSESDYTLSQTDQEVEEEEEEEKDTKSEDEDEDAIERRQQNKVAKKYDKIQAKIAKELEKVHHLKRKQWMTKRRSIPQNRWNDEEETERQVYQDQRFLVPKLCISASNKSLAHLQKYLPSLPSFTVILDCIVQKNDYQANENGLFKGEILSVEEMKREEELNRIEEQEEADEKRNNSDHEDNEDELKNLSESIENRQKDQRFFKKLGETITKLSKSKKFEGDIYRDKTTGLRVQRYFDIMSQIKGQTFIHKMSEKERLREEALRKTEETPEYVKLVESNNIIEDHLLPHDHELVDIALKYINDASNYRVEENAEMIKWIQERFEEALQLISYFIRHSSELKKDPIQKKFLIRQILSKESIESWFNRFELYMWTRYSYDHITYHSYSRMRDELLQVIHVLKAFQKHHMTLEQNRLKIRDKLTYNQEDRASMSGSSHGPQITRVNSSSSSNVPSLERQQFELDASVLEASESSLIEIIHNWIKCEEIIETGTWSLSDIEEFHENKMRADKRADAREQEIMKRDEDQRNKILQRENTLELSDSHDTSADYLEGDEPEEDETVDSDDAVVDDVDISVTPPSIVDE
jgi:hypothetical protein